MTSLPRVGLVALAMVTLSAPAPAQGRAAQRRLAVLIGNDLGHLPGRKLRYAERDAKKLQRTLVEVAGFAPKDTWLLVGRGAKEVRKGLVSAEARAKALRRRGVRVLLLIYYSGHADGRVLELGKESLPYGELRTMLQRSRAHVRLAVIDSCKSGAFLQDKGGKRRRRRWKIRVDNELRSRGYAVITSSADDELSQESAELRGSFFTHHLVSGLRGAADSSGDRRVTLAELYRHVYARTVASTSATIGGSQHPMYAFKLAGRGDLVLGRLRQGGTGALVVDARLRGRLLILDGAGRRMIAEVDLERDRAFRRRSEARGRLLALRAGRYRLYLQRRDGSLGERRLLLRAGTKTPLAPASFQDKRLALAVSKGGLFAGPLEDAPRIGATASPTDEGPAQLHRLRVGLLLRRMPLEGVGLGLGAALRYDRLFGRRFFMGLDAAWSMAGDSGLSQGLQDLQLTLGGGLRMAPWRPVDLMAGIFVGYGHLLQSDREGRSRHSSALVYRLRLGAALALFRGRLALSVEGSLGGRVFTLQDGAGGSDELTHRLELSTLLALGARF